MRNAAIIILAFAAAAAAAVNVQVPLDDITVNLSALMNVGYYYYFYDERDGHVGNGSFGARAYRLGVNGDIGERIFYRAEYSGYSSSAYTRNYLGVSLADNLKIEAGDDFAPFGVESQIPTENRITSTTTLMTGGITPSGLGVRVDYDVKDAFIPFGAGLGIYPYAGSQSYRLDAAAARVYADVWPGEPRLIIGGSYYANQELRLVFTGEYPYERGHKYVFAPRVGGDLGFQWDRITFQTEYMQYYIEDYLIRDNYPEEPVYKSTYERGYYGLFAYKHPLPWKYLQAFQPYARYERYEPAVLDRGLIAEDRYTGGFDIYFLANNLMLRADYTRILEDELRMKNDRIASAFQLFF